MLCSDGLTEMVRDDQIAEVLGSGRDVREAARKLTELALEAGGRDNVTVVLAHFDVPKAPRPS